jgi:anti-sigma factor RsiW
MSGRVDERLDLAAYALGLLPERDCADIEAHLAECDGCALELEALVPTAQLLAAVDRAAVLAAVRRAPAASRVPSLRRPHGRRLVLMLAASIVIIVAGVTLMLWPAGGAGAGERHLWAARGATRLDITLTGQQSGTAMSFLITERNGPLRCRLVTVDRSGDAEVVSSWQVPAGGYGTADRPARLRLQANSSLPVSAIARLDVEALDPHGTATLLLELPVD